jgi:ABC-type microcin C transport system permease subunit YejB
MLVTLGSAMMIILRLGIFIGIRKVQKDSKNLDVIGLVPFVPAFIWGLVLIITGDVL